MSPLDDAAPSLDISLPPREAFRAMIDFVWRSANRAGDDLLALMGDI